MVHFESFINTAILSSTEIGQTQYHVAKVKDHSSIKLKYPRNLGNESNDDVMVVTNMFLNRFTSEI